MIIILHLNPLYFSYSTESGVIEEESDNDPPFTSYSTESDIKQEIKEEEKELDEGQGIDYSEYVQVPMNQK